MTVILDKKKLIYLVFTICLCFCDIFGGGNFNLLFFVGVLCLFKNFCLKRFRDLFFLFIPFIFMIILEILLSNNSFDFKRIIIYCSKIIINISLLLFIRNKSDNIDVKYILVYVYRVFMFLLLMSFLTYGNGWLWRIGDAFNSFSKNRLQFFYTEPSGLGEISSVLAILSFYYYFFIQKERKIRNALLCYLVIIILTFSMSAIFYTSLSLIVMMLINGGKLKLKHFKLFVVLFVMCALVLITNNPISNRLFSMLLGNDSSFSFRWTLSIIALEKILYFTKNMGIGICNLNTPYGLNLLFLYSGMDYKFANSFPYFIAENGIFGILYILFLFIYFIINIINLKQNRYKDTRLRLSLLFFTFISQFAGGYFTNPFIWCVYGLICSKNEIFQYKNV